MSSDLAERERGKEFVSENHTTHTPPPRKRKESELGTRGDRGERRERGTRTKDGSAAVGLAWLDCRKLNPAKPKPAAAPRTSPSSLQLRLFLPPLRLPSPRPALLARFSVPRFVFGSWIPTVASELGGFSALFFVFVFRSVRLLILVSRSFSVCVLCSFQAKFCSKAFRLHSSSKS